MLPSSFSSIILGNSVVSASGNALYVNGALVSGGGGGAVVIPADVVRTTGIQSIEGNKTFVDATVFNDLLLGQSSFAISITSGRMYNATMQPVVSWNDAALNDSVGTLSVQWNGRMLYDSSNLESFDWTLRRATNSAGTNTVDWENCILKPDAIQSLNWSARTLYDSANTPTLSWEDKSIYGDWVNDSSIIAPLLLSDNTALYTIDMMASSLLIGSNIALRWGNRILSGNWSTSTVPTNSTHLINKGYLDSPSYSGNFNRLTGVTSSAPVNTIAPVSWIDIRVSGQIFKLPLFQ